MLGGMFFQELAQSLSAYPGIKTQALPLIGGLIEGTRIQVN
jgi:hypothetical protein